MILTYKVKHCEDFSRELALAKKVAEYSLEHKSLTSKDVKHLGLKSIISNQILRKYSRNKKIKRISSVKLIVPSAGIKHNQTDNEIYLPCLKKTFKIEFSGFTKINMIEIDNEYYYVSVSFKEKPQLVPESFYGVDRNTTGHTIVASNPSTGKVIKMGKKCLHIHKKYSHIRKFFQKKGLYGMVKKIKDRESRIIRSLNHQMSSNLVKQCISQKSGLVLENLKGIRKQAKKSVKSFRYSLTSWSFYQFEQMLEYKAKLQGIPIFYIEPQYTSQQCSKCGHIEKSNRDKKVFACKNCGHVENADVNAGFVIACRHTDIFQFNIDRDILKGSTDTP